MGIAEVRGIQHDEHIRVRLGHRRGVDRRIVDDDANCANASAPVCRILELLTSLFLWVVLLLSYQDARALHYGLTWVRS